MRAVTGLPIKFLGVSEKIDGLDVFDAHRVAGRILGQGDVVAETDTVDPDAYAADLERLTHMTPEEIAEAADAAVAARRASPSDA